MEGGHDVPITKIISRYYRSIGNCVKAASIVDRAYFYDNSTSNTAPIQLFRTVDGEIVKQYNQLTPWAENVAEQIAGKRA